MSAPARKTSIYEEFRAVPEHLVAEVVDGELYTSPRPGPRHSQSAALIGHDLIGRFFRKPDDPQSPGGWWILGELELHFGPDILVPDLAGWRVERLPRLPEEAFFSLAPDWVCEVLSPSTERLDRSRKKRIYAREAVHHLWLVNPLIQTLEVLRRSGDLWQEVATFTDNDKARAEPFEAVELDLSRWWLTE